MKLRGAINSWIEAPPHWLRRSGNYAAQVVSVLLLGVSRPVGYWVADRFGDYFYRRNTNLRANVAANMRHVMGAGATEIAVQDAARRAFRMQSRNGFDLLRVPRVSLKRIERQVRLDGDWAVVDDALAAGRGVILCTAHYGAFDIMGQFIINRGYDATLLVGRTTSHFVHDSVTYLRQSRGWHIEQVTEPGSVRRVMKALKEGKVVGMAVDRDWSGTGTPVTFFGAPTTLPVGPVRMALATGAEIVTVIAPRVEGNRYGFILRHVLLQRSGNTALDVAENMRRMLANIETVIAHDPGQWVLFRRVWPDEEGG
ncbi:MAG: lysophospholipid acyltransferase family protein [Chloroflexota bacterium]|nr:lysophospholipid acyltransferase family protein [Chloroflexota bacterium]